MKLASDDDGSALFAAGRMSRSIKDFTQDLYSTVMGGKKAAGTELPGDAFNRVVQAATEYDLRVQYGPRNFKAIFVEENPNPSHPLVLPKIVHELNDRELVVAAGELLGRDISQLDRECIIHVQQAWLNHNSITHVHRKNLRRVISKFQDRDRPAT